MQPRVKILAILFLLITASIVVLFCSYFPVVLFLLSLHLATAYHITVVNVNHFYSLQWICTVSVLSSAYLVQQEAPLLAIFIYVNFLLAFTKVYHLRYSEDDAIPAKLNKYCFIVSLMIPISTAMDRPPKSSERLISFERLRTKLRKVVGKGLLIGFIMAAVYFFNRLSTTSQPSYLSYYIPYYLALWMSYFAISSYCDFIGLVIEGYLNVPSYANFKAPFLATSPHDFWSNRWNLVVRNFFHDFIFIPLLEYEGMTKKSAALISSLVVFIVSGIAHELFVFVVVGHWGFLGYMLAFFTLHGVLSFAVGTLFGFRKSILPTGVAVLLFQVLLLVTCPLFLKPLEKIYALSGFVFP